MRRILIFGLFAGLTIAATPGNSPAPPFMRGRIGVMGRLTAFPPGSAHEPVIKVADASGKPIAGARVEFDAPKAGPGAKFSGGSTHYTTTTDAEGVAKAAGLRNNGVAGGFALLVHVSYQGQS